MSMEAFVRAAEAQSFAGAARQLGVAKSVVTSRVKQLEDHFGVPLFHRSTRAVRLSELGETYYRDCAELVNKVHDLSGRSGAGGHAEHPRTARLRARAFFADADRVSRRLSARRVRRDSE
jgi:DNA-binding transcriptional LysR family regulator